MPCKECGCTKAAEHTLAEETSNLTLSEAKESQCGCSAKASLKSCCSSTSNCCSASRPNRGCSCCCRSCCACCRCCSNSSRDVCQDKINESRAGSCSCCGSKKQEVVKPACGCQH